MVLKNVSPQKLAPKKNLGLKIFWAWKNILDPKTFWVQRTFWVQKTFKVQKFFGLKLVILLFWITFLENIFNQKFPTKGAENFSCSMIFIDKTENFLRNKLSTLIRIFLERVLKQICRKSQNYPQIHFQEEVSKFSKVKFDKFCGKVKNYWMIISEQRRGKVPITWFKFISFGKSFAKQIRLIFCWRLRNFTHFSRISLQIDLSWMNCMKLSIYKK